MASILVADDEAGIREFLHDTLVSDGHAITQAADASEALGRLGSQSFDLLITDLKMPGPLDGVELLRRSRDVQPELKVIVLTAHGTVGSAVEAMKLGATDYLEKPLRGPTELRILVSRTLDPWPANGVPSEADPLQELSRAVHSALGPDFTVEGVVGRGGYAAVFRVHDRRLDRQLAAKVLLPEFAAVPDVAERFRREARTLARLTHPNIVPVYFVARERDVPCFVMPFVEGEPLASLLARERQLPLPVVLRIARDVAAALDFAHAAGVLHRDVKPENILIDSSTGRSLLSDFGIAKALAHGSSGTGPGTFVGTPRYMSPEQASGDDAIDARSDVYSLAVVVYEMMAGKPPFDGISAQQILVKHLTARIPSVGSGAHGTPEVQAVMARALAKGAAKRFATAGAFVFALQVATTRRHAG